MPIKNATSGIGARLPHILKLQPLASDSLHTTFSASLSLGPTGTVFGPRAHRSQPAQLTPKLHGTLSQCSATMQQGCQGLLGSVEAPWLHCPPTGHRCHRQPPTVTSCLSNQHSNTCPLAQACAMDCKDHPCTTHSFQNATASDLLFQGWHAKRHPGMRLDGKVMLPSFLCLQTLSLLLLAMLQVGQRMADLTRLPFSGSTLTGIRHR